MLLERVQKVMPPYFGVNETPLPLSTYSTASLLLGQAFVHPK